MSNPRHVELQDFEENKWQAEAQPRKPKPHILFEGELPPQYCGKNLPVELAIKRNHTIKALILQLFSIFAGFAFFFVRRVYPMIEPDPLANTLSHCKHIISRIYLLRVHRDPQTAKMGNSGPQRCT
jgi:hypothetical protein